MIYFQKNKRLYYLPLILLLNFLGFFLLYSYSVTEKNGFWYVLDSSIFHYFNAKIVPGSFFLTITAITNIRHFDVISFFAMCLLFFHYFYRQNGAVRRQMISMGLCMLVIAVIIKQLDWLMPVEHPSPTLFFDESNRISEMVTFATKDSDGNCFPGDHGMMLFIFTAFMGRYFGRKAFLAAAVVAVAFSLPRIVGGAHWFGDIYAGALGVCSIVLSWVLLTPFSDYCIFTIDRYFPSWFFPAVFGRKKE